MPPEHSAIASLSAKEVLTLVKGVTMLDEEGADVADAAAGGANARPGELRRSASSSSGRARATPTPWEQLALPIAYAEFVVRAHMRPLSVAAQPTAAALLVPRFADLAAAAPRDGPRAAH